MRTIIDADLVVVGIGMKPALELAERAGLALDRGIDVDQRLQTSVPGIFCGRRRRALARSALAARKIRVEHWVVAERQGQTAARNMIGNPVP